MQLRLTPLLAAAGLLVLPAAAAAQDTEIFAGPPKPLKAGGAPATADDNAFYPERVTVRRGATVRFRINGLHNVLYAPPGTPAPGFEGADPADPVQGATDAAGAPAWFNGLPRIKLNPVVLMPTPGAREVDGSRLVNSGIAMGRPKPFDVKLTGRPGRYTFLCSVHPGMKADVTVVGRSGKATGAKADARRAARQYDRAVRTAKRLAKPKLPARTVKMGSDAGKLVHYAFFPKRLDVRTGETVTFAFSRRSTEIHNAAFGPKDVLEAQARRFLGPPPAFELAPDVVYASAPGQLVHDGSYLNTGILDANPASPLPDRRTVTFTKAGRYGFICTVHPDMRGTIRVS